MASKYPPLDEQLSKTKIYIGNLHERVMSDDLYRLFRNYGHVQECDVSEYGHHGFVHMRTDEQAANAIAALNGTSFMGRLIKVEQSISTRHRWRIIRSSGQETSIADIPSTSLSQVEQSSVPQCDLSAQCNRNITEQSSTNLGNFSDYIFKAQSNYSHAHSSNHVSRQSLESQINISLDSNHPLQQPFMPLPNFIPFSNPNNPSQQPFMPLPNFVPFSDPNNPSQRRMPFGAPNIISPEHAAHFSYQPTIGQIYVASLGIHPDVNIQSSTANSIHNVNVQHRTESLISSNLNFQQHFSAAYFTQPNVIIPQYYLSRSFPSNFNVPHYLAADLTNLNINAPYYYNSVSTYPSVHNQYRTAYSNQPSAIHQRHYTESSNQIQAIFQHHCDTACNQLSAIHQPSAILQRYNTSVPNQPTINPGFGPYRIQPTINRQLQSVRPMASSYMVYRPREPRTQRVPPPIRGGHNINTRMQAERAFRNLNINAPMPQAQPRTTVPVPRNSGEERNQSLEDPENRSSVFHHGMRKRE